MTRQEFIDNVLCWSELLDFCYEEGCSVCEDVYSYEERDERIDEIVLDLIQTENWKTVLDVLQSYEEYSGFDYYRLAGDEAWVGLDDNDFDVYKNEVLEYMNYNDLWEEDEDEEEMPPRYYINPEDTTPLDAEEISMDDLFMSGIEALTSTQNTDSDEEDFNCMLTA